MEKDPQATNLDSTGTTPSSCHPDQPGDMEMRKIWKSLKLSPSLEGLVHLGDDGVVRSFSSRGQVVDYRQLSPEEIDTALLSLSTKVPAQEHDKVSSILRGKDGRKVTDMEQILRPGPDVVDMDQIIKR